MPARSSASTRAMRRCRPTSRPSARSSGSRCRRRRVASRALVAAILLLAASAARAEDALGTLFLSAQERAQLDALRRGDAPAPGAAAQPAPREHALTGYVQRSDGRTTVWID